VFAFGDYRLLAHGTALDELMTNVLPGWAHHGKTCYASAMGDRTQRAVHYRRFLRERSSVVNGDLTPPPNPTTLATPPGSTYQIGSGFVPRAPSHVLRTVTVGTIGQ
jgi:hypothetical protein